MTTFNKVFVKFVAGIAFLYPLILAPQVQSAPSTEVTRCDPDFYMDHGTSHCEDCCDICCKANFTDTYEECQTLCPEYAKRLAANAEQVEKPKLPPFQDTETKIDDGGTSSSSSPSLPVGITVSALLLIVGVVVVVFLVRRFKSRPGPNRRGPAGVPPEGEDEDLTRVSVSVEEVGNGEPSEGLSTWSLRVMCDPRNLLPQLHQAQETESGQNGAHEIALLNPSKSPIYRPSGRMLPTSRV